MWILLIKTCKSQQRFMVRQGIRPMPSFNLLWFYFEEASNGK
jgi:hypothetical protein